MLTESIQADYIFTGNPFFIRESEDAEGFGSMNVYVGVGRHRRKVMSARFTSPLSVNLAAIVDGLAPETNAGEVGLEFRTLSWNIEKDDGGSYSGRKYIFDGAVGKNVFRQYSALGGDIFTDRFLSASGNFFWLPLQPGRIVEIKETELEPLIFFAGEGDELIITPIPEGPVEYVVNIPTAGVHELDMSEVRNFMVEHGNILPSAFNVERNGCQACIIVVTPADESAERYYLRFRNAFGVFERIELAGEMKLEPAEYEADDYKTYDSLTDDFITARQRVSRGIVLTVQTGLKTNLETRRLLEALMSPDVYLLGLADDPVRVLPSAESITLAAKPAGKQGIALKLTVAEDDVTFMPDIPARFDVNRIFTEQFTQQFK